MNNDDNNIIEEINNSSEKLEEETTLENTNELVIKKEKSSYKKHRSKKGLVIVIISILVLVCVVGVLVYILFFYKPQSKPETPKEVVVIEKDNYLFKDGTLSFLNKSNKEIGTYDCINKDVNKCFLASFTVDDNRDVPKYLSLSGDAIDRKSGIYFDKYAFVQDGDSIVLYDFVNNKSLGEYSLIKDGNADSIQNEKIFVYKNSSDKFNIVKITNEEVSNLFSKDFDNASIIDSNEAFVVKDGSNEYLISKSGEMLSSKIKGEIRNFNSKYISVFENNKYVLYDYYGVKVLDNNISFIEFNSPYIAVLIDKKLYIYDEELNKLNENGYTVSNKALVKEYLFDSKNNLSEVKKSFEINFDENEITIEYNNKTTRKKINLAEVLINKQYDYVSYLDGILYFYSNKEKTEILGSYNCSNKNVVTFENSSYDNCFVAKNTKLIFDSSKEITPIYNSKYALINDTKDSNKNSINIYDLTTSKKITVNYQTVDSKINNENINIIDTKENLIAAKDANGNYALFTLDANGLNVIIRANDEEGNAKNITLFKDYYLVKRNKNCLYSQDGKNIGCSEYSIVDYKYGKMVVKGTYYMIYNNGSIISNDYEYVDLHENYYVGITKDDYLNVYKYDSKEGFLEQGLLIKNMADYSKSYSISETSTSYLISIIESSEIKGNYEFSKIDGRLITNETE